MSFGRRNDAASTVVRLLVVGDRRSIPGAVFETSVEPDVTFVDETDRARERLSSGSYDCVLIDHDPPERDAVGLVESVRDERSELPLLVFTGRSEAAADAIEAGATDVVTTPLEAVPIPVLQRRLEGAFAEGTNDDSARTERTEREQPPTGYETIVETIPDGAYVLDEDHRFRFVNPSFVEMTGYSREDLLGSSVRLVASDEGRERSEELREELRSGDRETAILEETIRTADGDVLDAEIRFAALHDDDGSFRGTAGIVRDVSERKERERELQRTKDRFQAIFEGSHDAIFINDPHADEIVDANPAGCEMLGYSREELLRRGPSDCHPDEMDSFREFVDGVYEEGSGWTDELTCLTKDGRRLPSEISASAIEVGDRELMLAIVRDISDRKERREELEQYETIVETIPDGAYVLDEDHRFQVVNDALCEMTGYSEEELLGEDAEIVSTDRGHERGQELRERLRDGEVDVAVLEEGVRTADGDVLDAEIRFAALHDDDGSFRGTAGIVRGISERKEHERELEQYRALTRAANDVIVTIDETSTIRSINPAAEEVFGYAPGELIGERLTTLMSEDLAERHLESFEEYLETGERTLDWDYIEMPGRHRDGSDVPLAISFSEIEYEDERFFTGVVRDVSERKERERELEESERRYRTLVENFPNGAVALVDEDLRYRLVGGRPTATAGVTAEEVEGEPVREAIPPGLADELAPRYEAALGGGSGEFETELDGRVFQFRVVPVRDEDGEVFAAMGMSQDVTERKQFEATLEALHDSSQEFLGATTRADISATVVETATEVLDLPCVVAYRYDADRNALVPDADAVTEGFPPQEFVELPADESSITGRVFLRGETRHEREIDDRSRLRLNAGDASMRSGMFVPVGDHGIVVAGSCEPGGIDDRQRRLLEILTANAEAAYDRVERERALVESEERYRTLAENFPNGGVGMYDRDLRYTLVEGKMWDDIEPDAEDLEGETIHEALPPETADDVEPLFRAALDGETGSVVSSLGGRTYRVWATPLRDADGSITAGLSFALDLTEQIERERELERRARQQDVVADLGQRALEADDIDAPLAEATRLVRETLDADYAAALDLDETADGLLLRQGVGWRDGIVGETTVADDEDSQAGYTLRSAEPVVVEDFDTETRFSGPELLTSHDVTSGITVVVGELDDPWGILGVHTVDRREFTEEDVNFVQSIANVLAGVIERTHHERELAALNRLNDAIRDISLTAAQTTSREGIVERICERLVETDPYVSAWIGDVDRGRSTITPDAVAVADGADEDYFDGIEFDVDDSLAGRAFATGEPRFVHDALDTDDDRWRERARERGYRSAAALPIEHENAAYGVLNVYAEEPRAFDGPEGEMLAQLGELVGHAIYAVEQRKALISDMATELEFRIDDSDHPLLGATEGEATIAFERQLPAAEDEYVQFLTVHGMDADEFEVATERRLAVSNVECIAERDDEALFEVTAAPTPITETLADWGGRIRKMTITDGALQVIAEIPADVDVRGVVEAIESVQPGTELLAQRTTVRSGETAREFHAAVTDRLTDKQRMALEAAYFAGYFEWPRVSTGEEVAELLDLSAPTFAEHIRTAQRKLFATLFESESRAEA